MPTRPILFFGIVSPSAIPPFVLPSNGQSLSGCSICDTYSSNHDRLHALHRRLHTYHINPGSRTSSPATQSSPPTRSSSAISSGFPTLSPSSRWTGSRFTLPVLSSGPSTRIGMSESHDTVENTAILCRFSWRGKRMSADYVQEFRHVRII